MSEKIRMPGPFSATTAEIGEDTTPFVSSYGAELISAGDAENAEMEESVVTIGILQEFGSNLSRTVVGKKAFARLAELLSDAETGSVIYLDFAGVDFVSGSWIDAALVPLLDWASEERNDLFPVLGNVRNKWIDELLLVARFSHTCFLVFTGETPPKRSVLFGSIDGGQETTLNAVLELQAVTGAELERFRAEDGVRATAWNNRLKDLFEKRLLRREQRGRQQVYSPVVPSITIYKAKIEPDE